MRVTIAKILGVCALFMYSIQVKAQANIQAKGFNIPWTDKELIAPVDLVKASEKPLLFNIGVMEDIKGAKHIGAASNAENLAKFKATLANVPKNKMIVFYCGCCPFAKCPNIRPAYRELKAAGFTNIKLLNLPTNLNTDWTAKGY